MSVCVGLWLKILRVVRVFCAAKPVSKIILRALCGSSDPEPVEGERVVNLFVIYIALTFKIERIYDYKEIRKKGDKEMLAKITSKNQITIPKKNN